MYPVRGYFLDVSVHTIAWVLADAVLKLILPSSALPCLVLH